MVPPVRSRAARDAVPQWRFRRNARDQEGRQGVVGGRPLRTTARRFRRNARDYQSSSMAVFWGGSTWPTMALQGAKGRSSAKSRSA